jgi:hypothetical protein
MFYRLRPPSDVTWCDAVSLDRAGLDGLPWAPAERVFTGDLLRIALRHGVPSPAGLVVEARHTVAPGRADDQLVIDEAQAALRETEALRVIEQAYPGTSELAGRLDEKLRQRAEAHLAELLAAPVRPELAEHWRRLGGHYPD